MRASPTSYWPFTASRALREARVPVELLRAALVAALTDAILARPPSIERLRARELVGDLLTADRPTRTTHLDAALVEARAKVVALLALRRLTAAHEEEPEGQEGASHRKHAI